MSAPRVGSQALVGASLRGVTNIAGSADEMASRSHATLAALPDLPVELDAQGIEFDRRARMELLLGPPPKCLLDRRVADLSLGGAGA